MVKNSEKKRKGIVHINHKYCKRCGICVNFCPVNNLEIKNHILVELNKCIACRICQHYCPDIAIEIEEIEEINVQTIIAGKPGNCAGS